MTAPRVCVLRAPGTNCDLETAHAFQLAGGAPEAVHLFRLLEQPELLRDFQILCIPGGFSYGDDLGAGVVFGSQLRGHLGDELGRFLAADTLTLGICNGFQVLVKSGILPGGPTTWPRPGDGERSTTLTWNRNGRYTAVWVKLRVCSSTNVFLRGIENLELPVAHAEGRISVADPALLRNWTSSGQIALAYTAENQSIPYDVSEPVLPPVNNPSGSIGNIAGLGDPSGRILGLMPHPERFLFATHHPQWTRRKLSGEGTGQVLFRNAIDYFTAQ